MTKFILIVLNFQKLDKQRKRCDRYCQNLHMSDTTNSSYSSSNYLTFCQRELFKIPFVLQVMI